MKRQFSNKFIFCLQHAYFFYYRTQLSLTMEEIILRFPHLAEKIFQQLDNEDLVKSRQVEKLWQKFIDERNYPWLRIVNIPTILQDGNSYMHLAAQCGQMDMFEIILDEEKDKEPKNYKDETPFLTACRKGRMNIAFILLKKADELEIDLNTKDHKNQTAFHLACLHGHSELAEMIAKNSSNKFTTTINTKLKIGLNNKNIDGSSAFHLACWQGHSEIAEMIMKNSSKLNIDLNSKNNRKVKGEFCLRAISDGWTAFHLTCFSGHSDIAGMIMKNSSQLKMDLNSKDNYGWTAFHFACIKGHTRIVNMMIEQSESLKLDLEAKDNTMKWASFLPYGTVLDKVDKDKALFTSENTNNKTGYQLAKVFERNDIVNLIQMKMPSLVV